MEKDLKKVILVLGNGNDERGELTAIAKSRLDKAVEVLEENTDAKILLTAAFGPDIKSKAPHQVYMRKYLIEEKNIPEDKILKQTVDSQYTVQDAWFSYEALNNLGAKDVKIVTSDFHMEKAEYLIRGIFEGVSGKDKFEFTFIKASSAFVPENELDEAIKHNENSFKKIKEYKVVEKETAAYKKILNKEHNKETGKPWEVGDRDPTSTSYRVKGHTVY